MPLTQTTECPLHDPVIREVFRADLVLGRRKPKQQHCRNPQRPNLVHLAVKHLVHRQLPDVRHRADLALDARPMDHKQRLDEVSGRQLMLAHQLAYCCRPASTPRAIGGREGHGGKTRDR